MVGGIAVLHLPWDLEPLAPRPVSASDLALPSWSSESIRTGQLLTPSNWGLIVRPSRAPDKLRSFRDDTVYSQLAILGIAAK
jgi:hypothetical protein